MPATRLAWGVSRTKDHVNVILHQAKGVDLPLCFGCGFVQGREKPLAIVIILENGLAPVAAAHHVVNRAGIFNAQGPGHRQRLLRHKMCVNKCV